jgi:tetratricopeptide (TPR) repeat protein
LDVLGWGGFGVVYLVEASQIRASDLPQCHFEWSQKMALKTLRDEYLVDPRVRQRFRQEAQVLVDLGRHPFLVDCSSVHEIADRLYIATEYVAPDANGLNSLAGYLAHRPPDLAQSLRWAIQVCHGMEYAYSSGLRCHRDLKPANILITSDGEVKIADFGLAGVLEQVRLPDGIKVNLKDGRVSLSGQTQEGIGFGTPTHMPPEQFTNAASCDERSDIYAFGVVLYQMATGGQLPFLVAPPRVPSPAEMVRFWREMRRLHAAVDVPLLDSPLFPIVKHCLAKKPGERYQSFRELRRDLESLLERQTGQVVDPPKVRGLSAGDWCRKGDILATLGHREEAVACYDRALAISPRFVAAWNNKGRCLADQGLREEAIACYDQALALDPRSMNAWNNKGTFLARHQRWEEAIVCYDRALSLYANDVIALVNKGSCLARSGRPEEAIACFDQALTLDPNFAKSWHRKAHCLHELLRWEEAIPCYDRVLALDAQDPLPWLNKGICLAKLGKREAAIACYDQALALNAQLAGAWSHKAHCLGLLGRHKDAIACCERALALEPQRIGAWYDKGFSLAALGHNEESVACYERVLALDPQNAEAWFNQANNLYLLKRWKEVIRSCEQALAHGLQDRRVWFNKAVAEDQSRRWRDAMRSYEEYLKMAPPQYEAENEYARKRLRKLERWVR